MYSTVNAIKILMAILAFKFNFVIYTSVIFTSDGRKQISLMIIIVIHEFVTRKRNKSESPAFAKGRVSTAGRWVNWQTVGFEMAVYGTVFLVVP